MEPNPYESPGVVESSTRARIAKRVIGFGAILLLTPVATAIAIFAFCSAAEPLGFRSLNFASIVVFVGLIFWAVRARKRLDGDAEKKADCLWVLWMTPVAVGGAFVVSVGLWVLMYLVNVKTNGRAFGNWAELTGFWGPPAVVLLEMLRRAWRYR